MANQAVVGLLRTLITADASGFTAAFAKTILATEKQREAQEKLGKETDKLSAQAQRMVKSFEGGKLLFTANSLVAAITKVGGATKLTEAEQGRANATLSQAIAKYAALGQEAPKALIEMERATRGVTQSTSALDVAIKALQADQAKAASSLSGADSIRPAIALANAVKEIGGVTKLTGAEQSRVNSTLKEAIEKYKALGIEAPKTLIALEAATRRTDESTRGLAGTLIALRARTAAQVERFSGRESIAEASAVAQAVAKVGGATKLTASQQAYANAILTEAIAKYQALGKTAPKAMVDLEQATRKTLPPTQNLNLTLSDVGKSILTWAAGFVTAQAALNIFRAAMQNTIAEIKVLTVQGAAVGDVTDNFERLTQAAKQSGAALLGELRAGTHATIDDLTLMKLVNQDLTAGLKLTREQWVLLAKGGFALAQRDASSVQDALEKLNEALLTGRTRTIANLVGRINAQAAEERFAKSIGKTRDALTDEGKIQAQRVEIFRRLGMSLDRLGEQTDGLDEKVAQAQTTWKNFQNELGRTVATSPVILAGLDGIQELLAKLVGGNKEDTIKNIAKAIDGLAIFLVEAAKLGVQSAGEIEKAWDGLKSTFGDLAQDIDRVRATFILLKGAGKIVSADTVGDAKHQFADLVKQLADVGVAMANRAKDMDNLRAHQGQIDASTQSYIDILDKAVVRMRAAHSSQTSLGGALKDTGKATQGLTDDTDALTQASTEEKSALKALKEALDSIHKSSIALAPVQQETIRLLDRAGVSSDIIAKSLKLTTDQVNIALQAIHLYGRQYGTLDDALKGVTRSVEALTAEQKAQIKSGLDAGLSVEEVTAKVNALNPALHLGTLAVKQFGDALKDIDDLRGDIFSVEEKALGNFQNVLEAEANARAQLAQSDFNKQQQIAAALASIATRRGQADIELAKLRGASVTEVAELERREAQLTLNAVLGGIAAETQARELEVQAVQDSIDAAKAAGQEITPEQERALARAQADLEAQREIAKVQTQAAVEDFNLGERNKQEAIRRTTNVWIRAWDQMRSTSDRTIEDVARGIADLEHQIAGKLGNLIFGFRDVDTEGLKQAAEEAKKHFEEMKRSGKATAEELHRAFNDWRKKEEEANNTFAYRFKQLWHGIKSTLIDILNDILKYFIEQFIGGMIRAIAASKLGELIGRSLGKGWGKGAAETAPATGLLAWLIGGGHSQPTPPSPITAPQPRTPGIVPIPPAQPGGGGHVPTPPPIAVTSISPDETSRDRLRPAGTFHEGGIVGEDTPHIEVPAHWMLQPREVLIKAMKGEAVLTPQATAAIGGKRTIEALNAGMKASTPTLLTNRLRFDPSRSTAGGRFSSQMLPRRTVTVPQTASYSSVFAAMHPAQSIAIGSLGNFTPPSAIDFAVRGSEWAIRQSKMANGAQAVGPGSATVHNHFNVNIEGVLDRNSVREVFRDHIIPELKYAMKLNVGGVGSTLRYVTTGEP